MTEESSGERSAEAVVSRLRVGFVGDLDDVLMLRASGVGGDLRALVDHITLDQRHLVLSGVVDVSGHFDAVSGLAAD